MNRKLGFTSKEILITVTVIAVLAAIAIPSFVRARNTSQQNACINNLRMLDGSKYACSMVYRLNNGDPVMTASVNFYIRGATTPVCPAGGTYTYGNIGSIPECSITTPRLHRWSGERN